MFKNHLIPRFFALTTISIISTITCGIEQSVRAQTGIDRLKFNRCRAASQLVHFRNLAYTVAADRINDRGYVIAPPPKNTYAKRIWEEEKCWGVSNIYTWFSAPPNDDYEMCLVAAQLDTSRSQAPIDPRSEVLEPPSKNNRRATNFWKNFNCNVVIRQYYQG